MPETDRGYWIELEELRSWVLFEDERLLIVNKPALVVCHPSKHGPQSSLVGACRVLLGAEALHLVSRLDRETSGVVTLAKDPATARQMGQAMEQRRVAKRYLAILEGELSGEVEVDQPLGSDPDSPVVAKVKVRAGPGSQPAVTRFHPLAAGGGFTFAEVTPVTGRKHQIRAHAEWLGHRVVGDKIYGGDPQLFLEFIEHGWTAALAAKLAMRRQALHAAEIRFSLPDGDLAFRAPLAADLEAFCRETMGLRDNFGQLAPSGS
jgi:23S rRNA pseudouridine1911/1915/1917 synthase